MVKEKDVKDFLKKFENKNGRIATSISILNNSNNTMRLTNVLNKLDKTLNDITSRILEYTKEEYSNNDGMRLTLLELDNSYKPTNDKSTITQDIELHNNKLVKTYCFFNDLTNDASFLKIPNVEKLNDEEFQFIISEDTLLDACIASKEQVEDVYLPIRVKINTKTNRCIIFCNDDNNTYITKYPLNKEQAQRTTIIKDYFDSKLGKNDFIKLNEIDTTYERRLKYSSNKAQNKIQETLQTIDETHFGMANDALKRIGLIKEKTIENNDSFKDVSLYPENISISDIYFTKQSKHTQERENRSKVAWKTNRYPDTDKDASIDKVFLVDKGHKDGKELHCVSKRGIIFILNENKYKNKGDSYITALIARPGQLERLYNTCGLKVPEEMLNLAIKNQQNKLNLS